MEKEIILQIFSGGFKGKAVPYKDVEEKLLSVLPKFPVKKVIMGWSTDKGGDKTLYKKTAELLAGKNIGFYLWFPVFSETGALRDLTSLVDSNGERIDFGNSKTDGKADSGDEDFSFCCPNNPNNIEKILGIFEEEFSRLPLTGVFLDKIRYPSFANVNTNSAGVTANVNGAGNGFGSVASCFCPHCAALYKKENLETGKLVEKLQGTAGAPLGITSYKGNGKYVFEDDNVSKFFSIKADIIFRSMERICRYFKEKKLKTGFDVFAPFLSPFTGQDLSRLSSLCDFMKPMMYRVTGAPAGLPFETEAMLGATAGTDAGKRKRFDRIIGFDSNKKIFDLDFAAKELSALASVSASPVYAGIEINRKQNIAEVYPDYIEENIASFAESGVKGFVLSWDLLDAPEDNIDAVSRTLKKITA